MEIVFSGKYWEMLSKLIEGEPSLKEQVIQSVGWFRKNTSDTRLGVHPLGKRMKGKWAFDITGDIRIVFEPQGKHRVRFLTIGGHKEVYGR